MFDQLVESRPHHDRSTLQALLSIAVHTTVIAISIQLTRAAAETVVRHPADVDMRLARAPARAAPLTGAASTPVILAAPSVALSAVPVVVPTSLPPVDLGQKFDPSRFSQTLSTGDRRLGGPDSTPADSLVPVTLDQVDEPVVYLEGPQPAYPPALRQVGVEGSVALRYIVGVDGRAEPASIEVLRSTNVSFETPAIEAIRLSHFRAARMHGKTVRQVVEQTVRFTLGRG